MNVIPIFNGVLTATAARTFRRFNKAIRPRLVTYDLTYKCNCMCKICDIWKMPYRANEELNIEEIEKIFKDKLFGNLDMLRITGGEPFLRSDIKDVVKKIFDTVKVKILHITTNGSLTDEILDFVQFIAKHRINLNIQVSVDGSSSVHDDLRGHAGLFNKVYHTLECLSKEMEKSKFCVGLNQVISTQDLAEIDVINEMAQKFGFSHTVILASTYHEGKDFTGNKPPTFFHFEPLINYKSDWLEEFFKKVGNISNANKGRRNYIVLLRKLSNDYLAEGEKNRLLFNQQIPRPPCMAFFSHFRILPNGDIVSCCLRKDKVVSNLKVKKLSEIWYSKEAVSEREEIKKCSGCWVECEVSPSAFYSMDIVFYYLKKSLRW